MKNFERVDISDGQRIFFTGEDVIFIDENGELDPKPPPKFVAGHELVANMLTLSNMFFSEPLGTVGREWMVNGKRTSEKPKKMFIDDDESECVDEGRLT